MTTQTIQTIREFLALPHEALPRAEWLDSQGDAGSAWPHLRDYCRPAARQRLDHLGEVVSLKADRDGWREGVTVTLE